MIKNILLAVAVMVWLIPSTVHANWNCSCGKSVTTKFCTFCGKKETLPQKPKYSPPVSSTPSTSQPAMRDPTPPRPVTQSWPKPKEWFYNECNIIEGNVQHYSSGGYRYDRNSANQIGSQINVLRDQLSKNDINGSVRAYNELKKVYQSFVNGCQWQANMRHPRYSHVVSSQTPSRWDAENGWEFVYPGTSDLTVRRKAVQVRCDACRGNGYVTQKTRCYSCNGRGRVPNPAAQIGQAVNVVGGLVNAFGGRGGRRGRVPRVPQGPAEIRCSSCNGNGNQQQRVRCNKCSGTGKIYRQP